MPMSFSYWYFLRYFAATAVTAATITATAITASTVTATALTAATVTVATVAITLLSYWNFAADTKLSRCGWIDNSTGNT